MSMIRMMNQKNLSAMNLSPLENAGLERDVTIYMMETEKNDG